jgi:two-component system chemotaxis sensor kinase CheA
LLRNLFTHLLRNSVDHGHGAFVEERTTAAGKPTQGELIWLLSWRWRPSSSCLTLRDDGRGLALARIRQRALDARLDRSMQTIPMSQVAELIFLPGFSTAEGVTEVSGRGVGMDAVREFLARESGRIELRFRSQADAGQPFRAADFVIRLPASAAVAG